ncbi:TolC family protein [Alteromonas gilva]|uniref:TolC family protein n=1 Tax=Alteromonas gilva TaxID=2987522 RepID=A0ABT5L6E1_9ALTE|nr:TolC family protein [Alteromonas gilva]MDC8832617.1 TolC family protein [Alteromonas gilva]
MKLPSITCLAGIISLCWSVNLAGATPAKPQLPQLIEAALAHDFALQQSRQNEQAIRAQRDAVQPLPDPRVSLGLVNVPSDGFALNEQAMTQLKVGVSQRLPRGNSVALQQQALQASATRQPALRAQRAAEVSRDITRVWINLIVLQRSASLIRQQSTLLEQLTSAIENSYASSSGASQYNVLSMELLLTELADRLESVQAKQQAAIASLSNWLPESMLAQLSHSAPGPADHQWLEEYIAQSLAQPTQQHLIERLLQHPQVMAQNADIDVQKIKQQQVAESFEPQWEVNASYAYRQDDPDNMSRADFLSLGVSVDIPLFSRRVKNAALSATISSTASLETEKRLVIQQLLSKVRQLYARYPILHSRLERYQYELLPLRQQHYDAALNAYTSANGDFSDVLQSQLALIDDRMKLLSLQGDMATLMSDLDFYLSPTINDTGAAL